MRLIIRLFQDVAGVWKTADRDSAIVWTAAVVRCIPAIIKTRTLVPADSVMVGRHCSFAFAGGTVTLPGAMFGSAREMYCRRAYQREAGFAPRPGWAVVDLGANVGLFSLHAAAAGASPVVAIEAQTGMAREFHELLRDNRMDQEPVLVHALIGERSGKLSSVEQRQAASHWREETPPRELDDVLDECGVDRVHLMKIDIEGSEHDLFRSSGWLGRVDRIVMEAHDIDGDPEAIASVLEAEGFGIRRRDADLRPIRKLIGTGYIYAVRRKSPSE